MIRRTAILSLTLAFAALATPAEAPFGQSGIHATYQFATPLKEATSTVETLRIVLGDEDTWNNVAGQWLCWESTKKSGSRLRVWMLCDSPDAIQPTSATSRILRYVLQEGDSQPVEYRNALTKGAVLPGSGAWPFLFPTPAPGTTAPEAMPLTVEYLGHTYQRREVGVARPDLPETPRLLELRPDVLTGVPHNTRQVDETRRYDGSDYEYIPLTDSDFKAMISAGMNCFNADSTLMPRFEEAGVFYWGGGAEMPYPECLYRPLYLGPALFLDEPAVHVRDYVLRPRFEKEPAFRHVITPQDAMSAFEEVYGDAITNGAPTQFMKTLGSRTDVDLGAMQFLQPNIYSWETMVSSSAFELLYNAETPNAIVFEPPGRIGTRRTLPAMNMSYGCQIPVTGSDHFIDIIIGFVRGAARVSGKEWGISIYGGVDRTEAGAFISRAYETGATRFFYWDSAMLACVPFGEVLGHTRHLSDHAAEYPNRDLPRLLHAAEVAILLPPGYNLGHVHMGKGLLWGLPELNLERVNREGATYRSVMSGFFTEIERCIRQGVAFDLLWDLPQVNINEQGYREIVRVREDAKVEVIADGRSTVLDGPRTPERPAGKAPTLELSLSESSGAAPCDIAAKASIHEGDAPVYYSPTPDPQGVHHNVRVLWEVYGPAEEDYANRPAEVVVTPSADSAEVSATLHFAKPGHYRLRAATTDLAGRSAVVWKEFDIH